ncbi:MAG: hypothetical protein HZA15_05025 [Nitrospirae bacterium]|nr:hypothetical protein [Nitrospirota bacterium]
MKRLFVLIALLMLLQGSTAFGQESGPEIDLQSALRSSQIRQGDSMIVTASLVKSQSVISSPEFIRHLKMSAYVKQPDGSGFFKALFDNGLDGDAHAGDGLYTCQFKADQAGDYQVRVIAEGKGLKKVQEHLFNAVSSSQAAKVLTEEKQGHEEVINSRAEAKHEAKGRSGEPTAHKTPWVLMVIVNAVAAVLWVAGFLFLYFRMRRQVPLKVEKKVMEFGKFIRAQAEEKLKQLDADEKKEQEGATADSKVINELQSARILFLKGLLAGPKKAGEEMPELWNQIYRGLDDALKLVLKGKKTALDEIDVLQEKVEEIGGISEELRGSQALVDEQARKIAFLMSFKDVISESQQKFDAIKKKNRDLEQKLFDAAHKADLGEVIKEPLAEFQENYRQLELCVTTLENENERLVGELGRWQKELDRLKKQGPVAISEAPAEVLKENEDLREMVRELEASIKAKEKELSAAIQRFESLESEYMVLYQEKQAAQQQPDI